jgi:hypothetical protein
VWSLSWNFIFRPCFLQASTMANWVMEASKHHWAHFLQTSFTTKHFLHLFALITIKAALFHILLQNQVSIRTQSFAMPWYIYERSSWADSNELKHA